MDWENITCSNYEKRLVICLFMIAKIKINIKNIDIDFITKTSFVLFHWQSVQPLFALRYLNLILI